MRIIRMNNRKKKTILFIIASVLIAISVIIAILLSSYGPYDRVTQKDERTVLFYMYIESELISDYKIVFVDNTGSIYEIYPEKPLDELISSKEIWEGNIVGEVPSNEAISYYHKLCKIDEELFFYHRESSGSGMEAYIAYHGVRYAGDKMEKVELGDSGYYTENKYAESIVEWMKEWEY